jgi:hypothetical protein
MCVWGGFFTVRDALDNCLVTIRNSQKTNTPANVPIQADYQDVELFKD